MKTWKWLGAAIVAGATLSAGTVVQAATPDPMTGARAAHASRDFLLAFKLLLPLARGGNAEAQTRLGLMYHHGQGVREDDAEAFRWFRLGALSGLPEAQFQLANLYALGLGVPQEESEPDRAAARWYFEAASQGHAEAQHNLGILFLSGKGVVQSTGEALKWFRRASNNGHREAQRFIEAHPDSR